MDLQQKTNDVRELGMPGGELDGEGGGLGEELQNLITQTQGK